LPLGDGGRHVPDSFARNSPASATSATSTTRAARFIGRFPSRCPQSGDGSPRAAPSDCGPAGAAVFCSRQALPVIVMTDMKIFVTMIMIRVKTPDLIRVKSGLRT
jgi:hypothetical protein